MVSEREMVVSRAVVLWKWVTSFSQRQSSGPTGSSPLVQALLATASALTTAVIRVR